MNIDVLKVGELQTNCYIITKDNNCLIIDPGDEENFIIARIRQLDVKPVGIIITHNHPDHNKYAKSISEIYNIKIYDFNNLFEGNNNIKDFNFNIIYTPGHTSDSISIYFKDYNVMFTGDFLFKNSIGRVDLPTGNYEDMLKSIEKIKTYDEDIKIYPGHGDLTNLYNELQYNEYLR